MQHPDRLRRRRHLAGWLCAAALLAGFAGVATAAQQRIGASAGTAAGERYRSAGASSALLQPATQGAALRILPMALPAVAPAGDAVFANGFETPESGT